MKLRRAWWGVSNDWQVGHVHHPKQRYLSLIETLQIEMISFDLSEFLVYEIMII